MQKKFKIKSTNEKAITLIALIITIIVLLILAGVTIATLTGENGIITKANEAAKKTGIEEIQEKAEIAKQGILIDNLAEGIETTRENIIDAIVKEIGGTATGNLITTGDEKYDIMVKEDNKIEVVEKGQGYIDAEYKEASPVSDFEYTIDPETNTVTITKYIGTDKVVNIPETIEEKTVIELAPSSFFACNLQSVKIPDTIKTIGSQAFQKNQFTYIDIPKSVTEIGSAAFNENEINEEQAYIYGRTSTGEEDKSTLISYGGNKKNVTIPETVTTIGASAFAPIDSIESVIIGDNVTNIRHAAFSFCSNLKKVIIGKNVTRLGMLAFAQCPKLVEVEFKGDVPNFDYVGSGNTTGDDGDGSEGDDESASGTINVNSGWTFTYNENLKIKVPKGKLQDYKTAKITLNGEEYYNTLETWFVQLGTPEESWLDAFYK